MPSTFGEVTKTLFLNHESHKLHLEFEAGGNVYAGQPVKLNSTGQVVALGASDEEHLCIGFSLHTGASDDEVTIVTRGYLVIDAEAEDDLIPGPVKWAAYNSPTERNRYTDGSVTNATAIGWSLTVAAAQGDVIRILVKN